MTEFFSPVVGHAQNKASRWLLRCRLDCSSLDAHETGILKGMLIYVPKIVSMPHSKITNVVTALVTNFIVSNFL